MASIGASQVIFETTGLVAFWDFSETEGSPRLSKGTTESFPLVEAGKGVSRLDGGPYSGFSAQFDGRDFLRIAHENLGALNIHGKDAQVSLFVAVCLDEVGPATVAGIWSEGIGADDDSGTRQYAILLGMGAYGGAKRLTPHISAEGGVSRRADGSGLPWCADYAVNVTELPLGQWITLGFTYDSKSIRAYFNGVMEERTMDPKMDGRADPYFTVEGPGGGYRGMNPYYHGRGIFRYEPDHNGKNKPGGPADFTVGACYAAGRRVGNPLKGRLGGLAVFERALSDPEMLGLHRTANLPTQL